MNRGKKQQRSETDRRGHEDRRHESERRVADVGAPERRVGADRRQIELGPPERRGAPDRREAEQGPPPGWKDRRRSAERRIPQVTEVSFDEWVKERAERQDVAVDGSEPPGRIVLPD